MEYKELIAKLGVIVVEAKYMLRVKTGVVCIDAEEFNEKRMNQITRLLQRYKNAEWFIKPSDALKGHVMYKIYILR